MLVATNEINSEIDFPFKSREENHLKSLEFGSIWLFLSSVTFLPSSSPKIQPAKPLKGSKCSGVAPSTLSMDVAPSSVGWIEEISESYEAIETTERCLIFHELNQPIVWIDFHQGRAFSRGIGNDRSARRLWDTSRFSEYHSVSSPSRLIFNYLWIKEKSWLENVDFASVSRDFHQSFASFLPFLSFLFAPSILTRIRQKINFTINDWIFQIFSQSRLVIYISTLVFWS